LSILAFIDQRLERRREHPSLSDDRRRARDRQIMLDRVRYRWITSVLDQSLAHEMRIRLELARRPDAVLAPAMTVRTPAGDTRPPPADASVSTVFDRLGGGLLILGVPGSGKTTALLELAAISSTPPRLISPRRCRWCSTCPRGRPNVCLLMSGWLRSCMPATRCPARLAGSG
jgi:hypothetical protein